MVQRKEDLLSLFFLYAHIELSMRIASHFWILSPGYRREKIRSCEMWHRRKGRGGNEGGMGCLDF